MPNIVLQTQNDAINVQNDWNPGTLVLIYIWWFSKYLCVLVLWMKVASALEGLIIAENVKVIKISNSYSLRQDRKWWALVIRRIVDRVHVVATHFAARGLREGAGLWGCEQGLVRASLNTQHCTRDQRAACSREVKVKLEPGKYNQDFDVQRTFVKPHNVINVAKCNTYA